MPLNKPWVLTFCNFFFLLKFVVSIYFNMILSGQKYSVGDHMVVSGLILHPWRQPWCRESWQVEMVTGSGSSGKNSSRSYQITVASILPQAWFEIMALLSPIDSGKCGLSRYLEAGRGDENKPTGIKCGGLPTQIPRFKTLSFTSVTRTFINVQVRNIKIRWNFRI